MRDVGHFAKARRARHLLLLRFEKASFIFSISYFADEKWPFSPLTPVDRNDKRVLILCAYLNLFISVKYSLNEHVERNLLLWFCFFESDVELVDLKCSDGTIGYIVCIIIEEIVTQKRLEVLYWSDVIRYLPEILRLRSIKTFAYTYGKCDNNEFSWIQTFFLHLETMRTVQLLKKLFKNSGKLRIA